MGDVVRSALLPSLRLDLLPKASIDVFITILQVGTSRGKLQGDDDEACAAAAATTVASCALADAGIEMYGLVVGINGVILENQSQIIVDASKEEAQGQSKAAMSIWSMPALATVTSIQQWGEISSDELEQIMEALKEASTAIHYTVAKALKDSYQARVKQ